MTADFGLDAGVIGTAAYHPVHVGLSHGAVGEDSRLSFGGAEQPAFRVVGYFRCCDVFLQKGFELVMAGHLVTLAAFFMEAHPSPAGLGVNVLDAHFDGRADTREGVCEQGDDRPIAEADDTRPSGAVLRGDGIEEVAGLVGGEYRGLAFFHYILRPTNHARGVGGHDLTQNKPIEEHADGGELHFDGRRRYPLLEFFDISRDVNRLHVAEMFEAARFAPCGEVAGGPGVGFPCIGVPDIGGEEFKDAFCGGSVRSEEGGKGEVGSGRRMDSDFSDYD